MDAVQRYGQRVPPVDSSSPKPKRSMRKRKIKSPEAVRDYNPFPNRPICQNLSRAKSQRETKFRVDMIENNPDRAFVRISRNRTRSRSKPAQDQ